jgi:predicted AlkP superfamily phosphohydrolase/phosphomutase
VNPVAKIAVQGQEFILREKEWSGWKNIRFSMIPTQSVSGICMFYLEQIRPEFKLYVSPINIDPSHPALPISTPKSYSEELADKFGPFFTKGLPADTSALDNGALDEQAFLEQDDMIMQERSQMFSYELDRLDSGVLFYYVSSTDQRQHMFWRLLDKNHPVYDEKLASYWGDSIEKIYRAVDELLDRILQKADKDTMVVVLSDHGFAPFRWSFNVNTWLKENGYLSLINAWDQGRESFHFNTDWSRTKAYAYGLNSLFINQRGREGEGIVSSGAQKENLMREIARKLEDYVDPKTGEKPILRAALARNIYQGDHVDQAPDIILGYNLGYRVSWTTPLGRVPKNIIEDNTEKWSGDHMASPEIVPGILLMNQKIKANFPALYDLTPTILKTFGIQKPKTMIGNSLI